MLIFIQFTGSDNMLCMVDMGQLQSIASTVNTEETIKYTAVQDIKVSEWVV